MAGVKHCHAFDVARLRGSDAKEKNKLKKLFVKAKKTHFFGFTDASLFGQVAAGGDGDDKNKRKRKAAW